MQVICRNTGVVSAGGEAAKPPYPDHPEAQKAWCRFLFEHASWLRTRQTEGAGQLVGGKDTEEAFGETILACQLPRPLFLALVLPLKMDESSARDSGELLGMLLQTLALLEVEALDVLEEDVVIPEEVLHPAGVIIDGQIALED
jgi:hypothetical protein